MGVRVKTGFDKFVNECDFTLSWLGATEALWQSAPPATQVRKQLKSQQLEALYESAYLRLFASWENFLEDCCARMMARAATPGYMPVAAHGATLYSSLEQARAGLLNGRRFLLWHNPVTVADRVAGYLDGSPIESEIRANRPRLEHLAAVRHGIAHSSEDAKASFELAATAITGSVHRGRPGKLLRAADPSDPLNPRRWVVVFREDLVGLARNIAT